MSRQCSVCAHPESLAINEALILEGKSNRATASQFGLDKESVRRHKTHIPDLLVQASDDLQNYETDTILHKIESLERETLEQLEAAKEEGGDRRVVLAAIREQRQNIELLARVAKLIDERPQIDIHLNPEWIELRSLIVMAVQPYPEARESVLRALEGAANGSA